MPLDSPSVISQAPAAAILTGGHARRLEGRDKSALVVAPGGGSILEHQIAQLSRVACEILIVTSAARAAAFPADRLRQLARPPASGSTAGPAVRAVLDAHPDCGPLGAVATALNAASAPAVIVLAGDMPHVPAALLSALADRHARSGAEATVPESHRGLEPLCALYSRSAAATLTRLLDAGQLSLQAALGQLRTDVMPLGDVLHVGDASRMFRNINTPEDLQEPH